MLANEILLTTPTYPYPTLPANDSLTDATGQRFTKGDNIFTMVSHTHCFANHILAQNVRTPVVVMEYPRWEDFKTEVDKGYPVIGISTYPVHLARVLEMCEYIRKRSPATKILLGSHGGMAFRSVYDKESQRKYVDRGVHGEGVRFLRRFLGETDVDRPIRQALMPKAGGAPPFMSKYPVGNIAFLVSGLGCIGGCDFCSTTALFDQHRTELLSPAELVEHMRLYHDHFPSVSQVFVIEEDHFRYPKYLEGVRELWMEQPKMMEQLDWFAFGSIDFIGRYAEKYGWDALAETGIGTIFIGVESKFAGEHGYKKRKNANAQEVFEKLHSMGIRTVGAWMCGFDFHDHGNVMEDLNYLVSLYPTYQQLTRVSPLPGTALWTRMNEENRVRDVPWEDVHFWSSALKNVNFEPHETLNITEYGYDLLYQTWGPSILRRLDVQLSGYDYCRRSANPILRRHKSLFFKRQSAMLWTNLYGMDRFAPNGVVRRRVRKIDEKYRALLGEPTPVMKALARLMEVAVTGAKVTEFFDSMNRHPKEEPYHRYVYKNNGQNGSAIPYDKECPTPRSRAVRRGMAREALQRRSMAMGLKATKVVGWRDGDPSIDGFLVQMVESGRVGFGF
ncbi:MAG: hypothetical protein JRJ10_01125 [Deltaproteobacteria bacterium]|nr:hypothetical protein [Deltaproteobacteria bacterium]